MANSSSKLTISAQPTAPTQKRSSLKSRVGKVVSRILPPALQDLARIVVALPSVLSMPKLAAHHLYDFNRFLRWSAVGDRVDTRSKLRAVITMDYHRIEKGLALKEPRVGFGREVIQRLCANLTTYQAKYGFDETCQIAVNALTAYYQFNQAQGFADPTLQAALTQFETAIVQLPVIEAGGIAQVDKAEILAAATVDFREFVRSRYSIRQFAPDPVDVNLIAQAIEMAQKTPSVCNRQSAKVYVFSSEAAKQKVLSYQNGNRGFGDQASHVLIVVSDLAHFVSVGERYQAWIDGGMFAMSLVYGLHSLGLGTCCLNWSVERWADRALKRASGIKDGETVIMMIAVGHLPDRLNVAQSPRKPLSEVMIVENGEPDRSDR
jgi:nitroreductase